MTEEELRRLVEVERADERVRARIRERWLRQQAAEDATLRGVLTDLATAGVAVVVRTAAGRAHQGALLLGGRDHCTVLTSGGTVHVRLEAVVLIRPAPDVLAPVAAAAAKDGDPDRRLLDVLAEAAVDRPRVALVAAGSPELVTGRLEGVGADVLTLRLEPAGRCYLAAQSVTEVSFLLSG